MHSWKRVLRFLRTLLGVTAQGLLSSVVCLVHVDALGLPAGEDLNESPDYQALEMYARARISVEPPLVSPYTHDVSLLGGFLQVPMEGRSKNGGAFMVQRDNGKKVVAALAPDFKCVCRARRLNAKLMVSEEWFVVSEDPSILFTKVRTEELDTLRARAEELKAPDPTEAAGTFRLRVTEEEEEARKGVELLHMHHMHGSVDEDGGSSSSQVKTSGSLAAGGHIYVDADEIFDEEDPDGDLDL